nr:MAG TPA: hypothetical protein [Bacteriophage sp.]
MKVTIKADKDTDTVADMKTSIRAESLPHLYHRPNLS